MIGAIFVGPAYPHKALKAPPDGGPGGNPPPQSARSGTAASSTSKTPAEIEEREDAAQMGRGGD